MKRVLFLLMMCVLAVSCGDDDETTTSPSNLPMVFTAQLAPANEVPPVANAESSGHGSAQVMFTITRDANNVITAASAVMYFQLSGYPSGVNVIGAHIHPGVAGVNGGVIVSTGLSATRTVTLDGGTVEFTSPEVPVDPAVMQGIINNPSAFYFNVHSPLNPGGFSRGQLVRVLP